jgi:Family of unknown function (DUF6338)
VIPATLLGVVLLAAALGPGYLYVRYATDRQPRREQTQLQELIEMFVIGGVASVISAAVVLILADAFDALNLGTLADDPGRYMLTEPARTFIALGVFFGLSYGAVFYVAWRVNRGLPKVSHGSVWNEMFWKKLPEPVDKVVPLLTVELRDGRKVTGVVSTFTREVEETRELVLIPPMRVQRAPNAPMGDRLEDHFLILKDEDIVYIAGRYSTWPEEGGKPITVPPQR